MKRSTQSTNASQRRLSGTTRRGIPRHCCRDWTHTRHELRNQRPRPSYLCMCGCCCAFVFCLVQTTVFFLLLAGIPLLCSTFCIVPLCLSVCLSVVRGLCLFCRDRAAPMHVYCAPLCCLTIFHFSSSSVFLFFLLLLWPCFLFFSGLFCCPRTLRYRQASGTRNSVGHGGANEWVDDEVGGGG